jgi:RNA recognition motif-containing protein
MGINALSPSSDAVFATSGKKGTFTPIGSPLAVSPIGTPGGPLGLIGINGSLGNNASFLASSPLAPGLKSPIGSLRPPKRSPGDFSSEQQERPSWGSMGNLPSFGHHPLNDDDPRSSALQDPIIPALSMLGASRSTNGANDGLTRPEVHRAPLSPNSAAPLSPNSASRGPHGLPLALSPNPMSEYEYKQRIAMQSPSQQHPSPVHVRGPNVSLMKPAPLQRAGSAGGVLMHAPRRPPPSNVTSLSSQPNATEHSSWSVSGANSNTSYKAYDDGSEEWFDQFGGIEIEPAGGSGHGALLEPTTFATPSYSSYDPTMDTRLEMSSRMMGARYMPNQRAHFGSPRSSSFAADGMSPHGTAPTYLQHTMASQPLQMGMSPQTGSPVNMIGSPLNNVASYSAIKHGSRILMIHNFDQLGTDAITLRTMFATHGGVIRSVSPLPESNALLVSFFDLRHAQKAMSNLHAKTLPSGAILELQFHFLRDTGVMSKESNQGTLVIFNLDPSITNNELTELFGKYGEIKEIRESPNRKHKFVEFYDVRCAEKAIKALNKTDLHGRKIKIEPSRPGGGSKLETASAGRRGSLGSTMFGNAPLYTPSALNNHAFTHSTPTLPTMTPGFIGTPPANQAVPGFASFSPAAAPLLSHSSMSPYHAASLSPRFVGQAMDEPMMFSSHSTESAFGLVSMPPPAPLSVGQSPSMIGSQFSERRGLHGANGVNGTNFDEPTLFDRSVLDAPLLSSHQSYMTENSMVYHETSTTASLFGEIGFVAQPQDFSQKDVHQGLQSISDGLNGLLMSPNITPRSHTTSPSSSSSDSNGLEAPNSGEEENAVLITTSFQVPISPSGTNDYSGISLRFDIIIPQVLNGSDVRTTLMIKNIPNKYDQEMLLLAVNKHHQGTYDFFYLPIDFKNRCNVGYAFINFIDPKSIPAFHEEFDNKKWEKFNSEKVCRISYARIQGKVSMIEHFKNSSLMFEDPKCRPLIFHSDGTSVGKPEPFPVGPNVRPRSRKDSAGSNPPAAPAGFTSAAPSNAATSAAIAQPVRVHKTRKDKSSSVTSLGRAPTEQ